MNVVKRFGDFSASNPVSPEIPKGIFVTLPAPSGCGKATLIHQLTGISLPEEYVILVEGKGLG